MSCVGSKKRGLVTRNGDKPIDYDFNLWIDNADEFVDASELKDIIMESFNYVLHNNGMKNQYCQDSTSVISTKTFQLKGKEEIPFKIDICIVKEDGYGRWHRLIHDKTGFVSRDRWYWNMGPNGKDIQRKEEYLKPEYWDEVREEYINIKNMYLSKQDYTHPSFKCYIEAINNVYYRRGGCFQINSYFKSF